MLVALFTLLFLGGDSHPIIEYLNIYEDRVETAVTDKGRRDEAKNILKAFENATKDHDKAVSKTGEQVGKTVGNKDATDAEIDAVWDQYFQDVDAYHDLLLDARFEFKEHVNRDEWQAIFGPAVRID
jgi:hypothetical protein